MALPAEHDTFVPHSPRFLSALLGGMTGCSIVVALVALVSTVYAHTTGDQVFYRDVAAPAILFGMALGAPTFVLLLIAAFTGTRRT